MLLYQKQSMLATRIWIKSFSEYVHIYIYVCIHIHIYMGASMSNIYSIKNQTISNYSSWVRRGASLPPGHLHQAVYKENPKIINDSRHRPTDCSLCCPQGDVSTASDPTLADWGIAFPLRLSGQWTVRNNTPYCILPLYSMPCTAL